VVDQTARAAGLGTALKRLVPQGDDQISVQLDAVAFNPLLNWLLKLEREQRLTLINLNVDRTGNPGLVNVRIILQGSAQP
jgi:general secretion pathway protein M